MSLVDGTDWGPSAPGTAQRSTPNPKLDTEAASSRASLRQADANAKGSKLWCRIGKRVSRVFCEQHRARGGFFVYAARFCLVIRARRPAEGQAPSPREVWCQSLGSRPR